MAADAPKPRTRGRTIRNHAFAWAFGALFPYFLVLMTAVFGHSGRPFGEWFGLSVYVLVGSVLIAVAFCTLELGMLFQFKRSQSLGRKARAVIPAVVIFVLALLVPSPAITALIPPSATSIVPLAVIVAVAAALGIGVYISHSRLTGLTGRAGRVPRGMGPAGQH